MWNYVTNLFDVNGWEILKLHQSYHKDYDFAQWQSHEGGMEM